MINKSIQEVTIDDIQRLIEDAVSEGSTIEYKSHLALSTRDEREEFLNDVSSFVNHMGGDIIYGVEEESGIIQSVSGIDISDYDDLKLRIESLIRDGIEPRMLFYPHLITMSENKYILILRMKSSTLKPHRVVFGRHNQFYSRNSAGKYPMNTAQLREAFISAQALRDRIYRFRTERIHMIKSGDALIELDGLAKLIIHILPISCFESEDFNLLGTTARESLTPIRTSSKHNIVNFDGILSIGGLTTHYSYTQLFRNGIIEAVNTLILNARPEDPYIPGKSFEEAIIDSLTHYLDVLQEIGATTPILIYISLLNIKGYKFALPQSFFDEYTSSIDREDLLLPEIQLNDFDSDISKCLFPVFNLIWNACGYDRSIYYDLDGNRRNDIR